MSFRALLLERALVVLASAIVVWTALDARQASEAGMYASSNAFFAMMLVWSLMLFGFAIRDRQVEKLLKAAGLVRPWGEAILGVLGVAAVLFVMLTPGTASLAAIMAVLVASLWWRYRDLRRLQAGGHIRWALTIVQPEVCDLWWQLLPHGLGARWHQTFCHQTSHTPQPAKSGWRDGRRAEHRHRAADPLRPRRLPRHSPGRQPVRGLDGFPASARTAPLRGVHPPAAVRQDLLAEDA